jgi:hypothetical protein
MLLRTILAAGAGFLMGAGVAITAMISDLSACADRPIVVDGSVWTCIKVNVDPTTDPRGDR